VTYRRTPVSIVCVSNNSEILNDCLVRSFEAHKMTAPNTELIVVENFQKEFSTAGAALNRGASLAHNEVCVFVHQDVYLHSLVKLEEAAAALVGDTQIGLLGAIGRTANGEFCGRVRDRMAVLGRATDGFTEVDSLDELLFMARRHQVLTAPLSEDPNLAWHAYAVEYGARMRRLGKRVVAGRIPLTHNGLTANLHRLTEAHVCISRLYPDQLPIYTTCGVIHGRLPKPTNLFDRHQRRLQWLKDSRQAYLARRAVGPLPVVLSPISIDVDNVLKDCGEQSLTVVALESVRNQYADFAEAIELRRRGRMFAFRVADFQGALDWFSRCGQDKSLLLTNIDSAFLPKLRGMHKDADALLGFSRVSGFWMITGPAAKASPEAWRVPSAKPLGLRGVR
jgi:Glycosyltransferase like family